MSNTGNKESFCAQSIDRHWDSIDAVDKSNRTKVLEKTYDFGVYIALAFDAYTMHATRQPKHLFEWPTSCQVQ